LIDIQGLVIMKYTKILNLFPGHTNDNIDMQSLATYGGSGNLIWFICDATLKIEEMLSI